MARRVEGAEEKAGKLKRKEEKAKQRNAQVEQDTGKCSWKLKRFPRRAHKRDEREGEYTAPTRGEVDASRGGQLSQRKKK